MSDSQSASVNDTEIALISLAKTLNGLSASQLIGVIDWLLAGINYVKPINQSLAEWLIACERQAKRIATK